ncbi:hypothetical protein B0H34DRAFT_679126 [Crassisporium funariophilum]|nr:hypothetical protein B0H34DRAFT_679126 [Crassisporium funariophilum]
MASLAAVKKQQPFLLDDFKMRLSTRSITAGNQDEDAVGAITSFLNKANRAIEAVFGSLEAQLEADWQKRMHPPPSAMAQKDCWMERQQKYDDLLCMRPTERSGLPIVTLHPAFRNYRQRLRSKTLVPPDSVALQVAGALCEVMGGYFQHEKARGEKFDQCVEPLLPSWRRTVVTSKSEQTRAEPDRTLDSHGGHRRLFWLSVREDNVELGEAGDAYMQNSRNYHLYVKSLQEDPHSESVNFLKHGAPMFLLALIGPTLCVSGAFYDGYSCVVEPLGPMLWMLKDSCGDREALLAEMFQALDEGLLELSTIQDDLRAVPEHFPPGIPRIYDVFDSLPDERLALDTSKLFQNATVLPESSQHHFFTFTPRSDNGASASNPVLLKMVAGSYGETVHQSLAGAGYAPRLYGWFKEKDLPTVYVMEMLSEDWVTLWDFRLQPDCADYRQQISDAISVILEHLKQHNLVHGDLRANNVMLNVKDGKPLVGTDGTVLLKVIDFDWSGDAGKVLYPMHETRTSSGLLQWVHQFWLSMIVRLWILG